MIAITVEATLYEALISTATGSGLTMCYGQPALAANMYHKALRALEIGFLFF
jgi:hypothetical protein